MLLEDHLGPPLKDFNRSANIRCARLKRDATVPIEQPSTRAICSYERSSKYRSRIAMRNLAGNTETALRTLRAACSRSYSSACSAGPAIISRLEFATNDGSDFRRLAVSKQTL